MVRLTDHLIRLASVYGTATNRSAARVSTLVFNDGKRLGKIIDGGDIGTRPYEAAIEWFSIHWPSDLPWPDGVDRPVIERNEEAA